MFNIEFKEELTPKDCEIIDQAFNQLAINNGVTCNYRPFVFVAKEDNTFLGLIAGNSYYSEIHISDLLILEQYRNKHIGSKLVKKVEDYFKDKGFENINLSTYGFQAPEFYKKCGFQIEYVRKNKDNPALDKYYLVKYI